MLVILWACSALTTAPSCTFRLCPPPSCIALLSCGRLTRFLQKFSVPVTLCPFTPTQSNIHPSRANRPAEQANSALSREARGCLTRLLQRVPLPTPAAALQSQSSAASSRAQPQPPQPAAKDAVQAPPEASLPPHLARAAAAPATGAGATPGTAGKAAPAAQKAAPTDALPPHMRGDSFYTPPSEPGPSGERADGDLRCSRAQQGVVPTWQCAMLGSADPRGSRRDGAACHLRGTCTRLALPASFQPRCCVRCSRHLVGPSFRTVGRTAGDLLTTVPTTLPNTSKHRQTCPWEQAAHLRSICRVPVRSGGQCTAAAACGAVRRWARLPRRRGAAIPWAPAPPHGRAGPAAGDRPQVRSSPLARCSS